MVVMRISFIGSEPSGIDEVGTPQLAGARYTFCNRDFGCPAGQASRSSYNHPQMPRASHSGTFSCASASLATVAAPPRTRGRRRSRFRSASAGSRSIRRGSRSTRTTWSRSTLHTDDIAHSLTIDEYRIAKRVGPGHPVTFEFRADRAGTFPYYCNLQIEDGCRQMHGELVVRPRPR